MKLVIALLTTWLTMASCDTAVEKFASGNLKFTARLYNEILRENPNKNFVFSPFSIEVILALTRAGAKGRTAQEFSPALNLPSEQVTQDALKQFLSTLKNTQNDIKLSSANKMYLGKNFKFLDSFKNLATSTFDAGIENVDFSKNIQAANTINQWVEQQTNNKIKNLVNPDSLSELTRLVLVNALYFSGQWQTPFNPHTLKEKFYLSNTQSKEVDMMNVEDSFGYLESPELNAKFLELPYLGGNISMTVVLPNQREGLSALENNLGAVLAPKKFEWHRVAVKMPSFLVESDLKLVPMLQNLGLTTIFTDNADLSGISKEPLKVDDVVQKAFINVTTTGTEAAAATAVYGVLLSANVFSEMPEEFIADRPFMYYIKYKNVILFAGKIKQV